MHIYPYTDSLILFFPLILLNGCIVFSVMYLDSPPLVNTLFLSLVIE